MFTYLAIGASVIPPALIYLDKFTSSAMSLIGYRNEAVDKAMAVFDDVPLARGFFTIAKTVNVIHFIKRRYTIAERVITSPLSLLTGAALHYSKDSLVEKAVKVAQVGRILCNLSDRLKALYLATNHLWDEIICKAPSGHQFLAQEGVGHDYTGKVPYDIWLYQKLPERLGACVFRIDRIAQRLYNVGAQFLNVSSSLLDLQYALNTSASSWDKFEFVDNVKEIFSQVSQIQLDQFLQDKNNDRKFRGACLLLEYPEVDVIVTCMKTPVRGVAVVIKGIVNTVSVARNALGI